MPDATAKFFCAMWGYARDAGSVDGDVLQDAIFEAGLGEWREATADDVEKHEDVEIGDLMLVLTDAGKAALAAGKD